MYVGSLVLFFIVGTIFGSFFNVVGIRLPKKHPFITGRSICAGCCRTLKSYELIPVLSYVLQRGKCRHCNTTISPHHIWIEIAAGVLFSFSFYQIGWQLELMIALLFISMLLIIVVTDIVYMIIPDSILLFFLPLFILLRFVQPLPLWYDSLLGAGVGFGILCLLIICSKGGMGAGDMKLFALIGIVLGTGNTILTLFIASLFGAIGGSFYLYRLKTSRKHPIPFGPYIVAAAILCYFSGSFMWEAYFRLF